MSNCYRGPSIDAFYQVSVHLAKRFQRRRFFLKLTNQKQELPVVAMFINGSGQDVQSLQRPRNRCFLLSFGSFGQAVSEEKNFQKKKQSVKELPLAAMFVNRSRRNVPFPQRTFHRCFLPSFDSFAQSVSDEKIFLNRPTKSKNCLWWPCLLTDQDEMSNLYRVPSIEASYQDSVHLVMWFQRRLKCEKLTDNRRRTPSDGKSSLCLW